MRLAAAAACIVAMRGSAVAQPAPAVTGNGSPIRPNIILILTDDEDRQAHAYMPRVRRLLHEQGTTFDQYFVTYALCCPSRASILRGQYPHNTGVVGNLPPTGGYARFVEKGDEVSTVATWLQGAGYYTSLIGKYLNGYDSGDARHVPPGWSDWHALVGRAKYVGYEMSVMGRLKKHGSSDEEYQTDVLRNLALSAMRKASERNRPLFLYLATAAPHLPAQPAPRHLQLFGDVHLPRGPSYDEADVSDKPPIIRDDPRVTAGDTARFGRIHRRRLQTLQAVDEAVEAVISALQASGQLDNTYIVYTSDNGWHMGEHRLHAGKNTAYEEDIRLPLVIRGPGVPAGQVITQMALNIDLAPTIAELAHVSSPDWVDGRSLVPLWKQPAPVSWRVSALVQRGSSSQTQADEGDEAGPAYGFHAVRTDRYTFVDWASDDRELYDLVTDAPELHNLVEHAEPRLVDALQDRVDQLARCKAAQCRTLEDLPLTDRDPP
jgi:arylsulfatase A-like enzyme